MVTVRQGILVGLLVFVAEVSPITAVVALEKWPGAVPSAITPEVATVLPDGKRGFMMW